MQAADAAGTVSVPGFRDSPRRWHKADGSLVTEVDIACERAIGEVLLQAAPHAAILGEEQGEAGTSSTRWVIDPIDGTENFARGVPIWGSLIAWQREGQSEVAVIDAPVLGMRWWAVRGAGAYSTVKGKLSVSAQAELSEATLCYGGHHEWMPPYDTTAMSLLAKRFRCAWGWGNFFGHMLVAEGAVDCAVSIGTSVWDVAAPSLIVAEASGAWSDAEGHANLHSGSFVTANPRVLPQVIRFLR